MHSASAEITLETAWQPLPDGPAFDRRLAAHLFRRAGFGAASRELDRAVHAGLSKTVASLLAPPAGGFDEEMRQFAEVTLATGSAEAIAGWWLHRIRHTPAPLVEKMTLFCHGHFATSAAKVNDARLLYQQNEMLRRGAIGSFGDLVRGIARDPAMLLYLDSATNRKNHPNENFAREVMELFCLGVDRYTERDIRELARCFTGWEIQHGRFVFNSYQHDYGVKSLLGRQGSFDGDEALEVVLDQHATAEFICDKLVRFFIADDGLPREWVASLAEQFRQGGLALAPVLETIFRSRVFYSERAIAQKVRSPVELGVGLLRTLELNTNMVELAQRLRELGQGVFFPPNVKGWGGGRHWIDSSTLLGRANLVRRLVSGPQARPLEALLAGKLPADAVDMLTELLLAVPPPAEVRAQLPRPIPQLVAALGALPEFQLT